MEWHGRVNSYESWEVGASGWATGALTCDNWTGDVPL